MLAEEFRGTCACMRNQRFLCRELQLEWFSQECSDLTLDLFGFCLGAVSRQAAQHRHTSPSEVCGNWDLAGPGSAVFVAVFSALVLLADLLVAWHGLWRFPCGSMQGSLPCVSPDGTLASRLFRHSGPICPGQCYSKWGYPRHLAVLHSASRASAILLSNPPEASVGSAAEIGYRGYSLRVCPCALHETNSQNSQRYLLR